MEKFILTKCNIMNRTSKNHYTSSCRQCFLAENKIIKNYNFYFRSLSVGSNNVYNLFSLNSIDTTLEHIYSSYGEDICLIERLFSSSLVAIVSLNAPRKLKVQF